MTVPSGVPIRKQNFLFYQHRHHQMSTEEQERCNDGKNLELCFAEEWEDFR